jgi:threonine aldolase
MPQKIIDLRSDTITLPSPEMRKVMASAPVGDDVFGDDPSVNRLESFIADLLGKESALFMPSGTMANQIAIRCHTSHGDEILIDGNAHIYWYEAGAPAALSGVTCKLLPGVHGIFTAEDVFSALRPKNDHYPPTTLLCIENTHNRGGGSVWPIGSIREVTTAARNARLSTHLDGARLWNASVSTGISESEYAAHFDSVSVCFSKGLGAPVGSALAGTREFVSKARRYRKQFGGGMRQSGILAAAAQFAVENNRMRLAQDHENARELAHGLASVTGIEVNPGEPETNMVYFELLGKSATELVEKLREKGVWVMAVDEKRIRAVLNLMVLKTDIETAVRIIADSVLHE